MLLKWIKYSLLLGLVNGVLNSSEIFQSVRVFNPNNEKIALISNIGIPLDHISGKAGIYLDIIATQDQVIELIHNDIDFEILISDLTKYYQENNRPETNRDFPLGSMLGNYTWDELNERFDILQEQYSEIISDKVIIGQSIEGRDIWAFKVSDNPNEDEDEPEVLYNSLTHSREPVGMMSLFYFVQHLGEEYNSNSEITYLIENREMWFIPVVNPDGYVYNESIEPNGGGMHRKNRRDTNCGNGTSRGVDLNRNFGYNWGENDIGSSPNPCSDVYRGESSFSEPETQALRDFILNHNFKNVLNFHTYANTYIHPFGSGLYPEEPDLTTHREIGNELSKYNKYFVGTCPESIGYTVNGGASDWTYGDAGLISFAPEVGSGSQGFWPPENEIIDLCESQLHPNKIMAFVSGSDFIVYEYEIDQIIINAGDDFDIDITIQNRGLTNSENEVYITIEPLNNMISTDIVNFEMSAIDSRDSDSFSVGCNISNEAMDGLYSGLIITIESEESFSRDDTIKFIIGTPEILFYDGFEQGDNNWTLSGDWGLTEDAQTGIYALTDSPEGDYQEAQTTIAEMNFDLDLSLISIPKISFQAKWDIESNYDFVRIQVNTIEEGWISLVGNYTSPGTGQTAQPFGEPGYDGFQESWAEETILLDQIGNVQITSLRFIQTSDNFVEGDGFVFDDFTITGFPNGMMGDFNLDSYVDIFDLLGIADVLIFGEDPSNSQLFLCDLDGSGTLDIMDMILLSNMIMGF